MSNKTRKLAEKIYADLILVSEDPHDLVGAAEFAVDAAMAFEDVWRDHEDEPVNIKMNIINPDGLRTGNGKEPDWFKEIRNAHYEGFIPEHDFNKCLDGLEEANGLPVAMVKYQHHLLGAFPWDKHSFGNAFWNSIDNKLIDYRDGSR